MLIYSRSICIYFFLLMSDYNDLILQSKSRYLFVKIKKKHHVLILNTFIMKIHRKDHLGYCVMFN